SHSWFPGMYHMKKEVVFKDQSTKYFDFLDFYKCSRTLYLTFQIDDQTPNKRQFKGGTVAGNIKNGSHQLSGASNPRPQHLARLSQEPLVPSLL
ncbi:mCG144822, partial [Mus musculus]